jgi:hypothetical protein
MSTATRFATLAPLALVAACGTAPERAVSALEADRFAGVIMNRRTWASFASAALSLILLAGCGSDSTGTGGRPAVASVTVTPSTASLMVGDTVRLAATVLAATGNDSAGRVLTDRTVAWTSTNPSVATVSPTGLVTGIAAHPTAATITATADNVSGFAAITVHAVPTPVSFASVATGASHTCGRSQAGAALCWGNGEWGALGDGSRANAGTPQAVTGGLVFTAVSAGGYGACGLTSSGAAHCWGADATGSLGAGTPAAESCYAFDIGYFPCSTVPLAVTGGSPSRPLAWAIWGHAP